MSKIKPVIIYIDNTYRSLNVGFNQRTQTQLDGVPWKVIRPQKYRDLAHDILLPNHHFESREAYSLMVTSSWFYRLFEEYTHALFLYNDCFILGDTKELEFWCMLDFGFIGAPHFKNFNYEENPFELQDTMNGGLCLRNIRDCIDIFSFFEKKYPEVTNRGHDDVFNSQLFRQCNIHMPSPLIAAKFSWECGGVRLHQLTRGILPFGIHDPTRYINQHSDEIKQILNIV